MDLVNTIIHVWHDIHLRNTILASGISGLSFLLISLWFYRRMGIVLGTLGALIVGGWVGISYYPADPLGLIILTTFILFVGGIILEGLLLAISLQIEQVNRR